MPVKPGFTIIEMMLFLAVSGAMAAGIMVGVGATVNAQRYRDATHSLVSFFQGEYDRVVNVQNDHDRNLGCSTSGISQSITPQVPGTSECTIIGRFITTGRDGRSLIVRTIYATRDGSAAATDYEALTHSGLVLSDTASQTTTYELAWETALRQGARHSYLIVRSPSSGAIKTYIGNTDNPMTVLSPDNDAQKGDTNLCIDPDGLVFTGISGAVIARGGSSASSVKLIGGGIGQC